MAPGKPARFDHHYARNGVANLFMLLEPLTGRCQVKVTERRTRRDWAVVMKVSLVLTADFTGDGLVNYDDFWDFVARYGTREGDANYSSRHDLTGKRKL